MEIFDLLGPGNVGSHNSGKKLQCSQQNKRKERGDFFANQQGQVVTIATPSFLLLMPYLPELPSERDYLVASHINII